MNKLILALLIMTITFSLNACKEKNTSDANEETNLSEVESTETVSDEEKQFEKTLSLQGVTFYVTQTGAGSLTTLTVVPSGLEISNETITMEVDGSIVNAETEDLNADGSPELLVYAQSAGSGSYGSVFGFSTLNKKTMVPIFMSDLSEDPVLSMGYMGHDEFLIGEMFLVRRFPIYKDGDSNSNPTGGTRQIQYKLVSGESAPQFTVFNSIDLE